MVTDIHLSSATVPLNSRFPTFEAKEFRVDFLNLYYFDTAHGEEFAEVVFPASVGVRMVRRKSHATPTIMTEHGDQTCNGGLQSYCGAGFKPASSQDKIKKDATDAAKGAAERVAENGALDLAAKAFCRAAVPQGERSVLRG